VPSADGSPISYGVKGQGTPVIVFVHCWTCDHHFWNNQIEHFSRRHKVVWLDLAGHGQSGSSRSNYTMEAFGQDIAAVVNATGEKNVVLVGHSMGGPVALEAAKLLDDKVIAIVGVDTFHTPFHSPTTDAEIEGFVKPFKQDFVATTRRMIESMFTPNADPELKASTVKWFSGANPEMGISAMYEMLNWGKQKAQSSLKSFSGRLKNINAAPTGNEKPLHKSVRLVPGAGHFIPQVKPDEFNAELNSILQEYR
jgi:pimeloyl-ACP methyl ester carboxylesterase